MPYIEKIECIDQHQTFVRHTLLILVVFVSFITGSAFDQTASRDSVQRIGNQNYRDGHGPLISGLMNQVRFDAEATVVMEKGKINFQASAFLALLGIATPSYPISQLVRSDEPNWLRTAAGLGAIGLSSHLRRKLHENTVKSLKIYHRNLAAQNVSGSMGQLAVFFHF